MDQQFFNNEIAKIALVVDLASFSDHCVTHRPNLHIHLNCSIFGKFLTHTYFSILKEAALSKPCLAIAGVYSLHQKHMSYSLCLLCLT